MMNTIAYDDGTCIDQWMLGIGEVWYFSPQKVAFRPTDDISVVDDDHHCMRFKRRLIEMKRYPDINLPQVQPFPIPKTHGNIYAEAM